MRYKKRNIDKSSELSFQSLAKYFITFYIVIILIILSMFCINTIWVMKKDNQDLLSTTSNRIEDRVGETIKLLNSLSKDNYIIDNSVNGIDKSKELSMYSDEFGYMMICFVDKNIIVWDEEGGNISLAGRDYMQKLFATKKYQVTDSFAAGADGKTLNYTIASPIIKNGNVDGCVFAAIYFDEIKDILKQGKGQQQQNFILFGSENQIMNLTSDETAYGEKYMKLSQKTKYLGTNAKKVEKDMFNNKSGDYWAFENGKLYFMSYKPIKNTNWSLFCKVNFLDIFALNLIPMGAILSVITLVFIILICMEKSFMKKRMEVIDMLLGSVQELEKRIYQTERPSEVDFKEIIQLTSKGLTDGLTGVVTRTVFFDQIYNRVEMEENDKLSVISFVDLDDLKCINDLYGHEIGDMVLKNVGYVLREYEIKYNGLIGRYGGDEFVMLLSGFTLREEVEDLLDEIAIRLHTEVLTDDGIIQTHCSVGAVVCSVKDNKDIDNLLKQADEALYYVKRNGKGNYHLV
ncbi:sensor domain-containing diguanylate cyclase [Clostridioides difficile]|uniref:sensor domain-containing diguanylate cyclase n=1 Tax=Clostridioides difficile TaxID=1496 RepID=UPI0034E20671